MPHRGFSCNRKPHATNAGATVRSCHPTGARGAGSFVGWACPAVPVVEDCIDRQSLRTGQASSWSVSLPNGGVVFLGAGGLIRNEAGVPLGSRLLAPREPAIVEVYPLYVGEATQFPA